MYAIVKPTVRVNTVDDHFLQCVKGGVYIFAFDDFYFMSGCCKAMVTRLCQKYQVPELNELAAHVSSYQTNGRPYRM